MGDLRDCPLCGIEHDDIAEGQFCKKCTDKLEAALKGIGLDEKAAENLAWLLSNMDFERRWAGSEIVDNYDHIENLQQALKKHEHSPQGKVLVPYERTR